MPVMPFLDIPDKNQAIGSKEYPFFYRMTGQGQFSELPKAVLEDDPYPVRGLLIVAASPALTYPDKELWHEVYKKLDFLVVNERFMSEDAMYADVIFPATTYYENQIPVSSPFLEVKCEIELLNQSEKQKMIFIYFRRLQRRWDLEMPTLRQTKKQNFGC